MTEPKLVVEENNDPVHSEKVRAQHERASRNSIWLADHWPELLPAARGQFVAVAGEEAFVAETSTEAWRLAKAAHPDDDGAIMQFVRQDTHARIYGNRGVVAPV